MSNKLNTKDIFECTRCGYCCQGETTVSLDEEDQQRMVDHFGGNRTLVSNTYWRITGTVVQMNTVAGHCIFYDEGCKVHAARPKRCSEWPLHSAILVDESNYQTIADSCPGIKKELGYRQFAMILRELIEKGRVSC